MSSREVTDRRRDKRRDERVTADRYGGGRNVRRGEDPGSAGSARVSRRDDDDHGGRYERYRRRHDEHSSSGRRKDRDNEQGKRRRSPAAPSSASALSRHGHRAENDSHRRHRRSSRSHSKSADSSMASSADRQEKKRSKLQVMELTETHDAPEEDGITTSAVAPSLLPLDAAPGPLEGSGGKAMTPQELLFYLQQQQQAEVARSHPPAAKEDAEGDGAHGGSPVPEGSGGGQQPPTAPARQLPSVEDFIPVVPKSLLSLIRSTGAGSVAHASLTTATDALGAGTARAGTEAAREGGVGGMLSLLEAPKISPDAERRARESRRAHISGFPHQVTHADLMSYFQRMISELRRFKTQREVRDLALAAGDSESQIRQIPPSARIDVDEIRDLSLNASKSKPFAFIEVNLADLITEMVEQSEKRPDRFVLQGGADRQSYPILIRRPRDYEPLGGVDENRVVMMGFPATLPAEKLRVTVFEPFGELVQFEVKEGMAYAEYASAADALECRTDLHGKVLGGRMIIVLPLYDWLKCVCVKEGIDINIRDDDPISGKAALNALHTAATARSAGGDEGDGGGVEGGSAGGWAVHPSDSTALVVPEEKTNHMKDLLMMAVPLPEVIRRLCYTYPHLRPLYSNSQVPIYPTTILVLLNLFDEEELVLDSTYSQLMADIEEEVEAYGRVERLIVPRREARPRMPEAPKRNSFESAEEESAAWAKYEEEKRHFQADLERYMLRQQHPVYGGIGRVFVVYETVDEAAYAQERIAGKLFGGRTVITSFLFEDLLREDDDDDDDNDRGDMRGEESSPQQSGSDKSEEEQDVCALATGSREAPDERPLVDVD